MLAGVAESYLPRELGFPPKEFFVPYVAMYSTLREREAYSLSKPEINPTRLLVSENPRSPSLAPGFADLSPVVPRFSGRDADIGLLQR